MNSFPSGISFKYPWRLYQKRVLDDLDLHLQDQHLHVIAPPGSGKTVLGLEVMLRINRGALILAPTLAIRNQWIQRFCTLFLDSDQEPDWISRDIKNPKFITVATYQGLHMACHDSENPSIRIDYEDESDVVAVKKSNFKKVDQVTNMLKEAGIATLVVDEAHHLKNEWWQTLTRVKEKLNPQVIGLTATPPYDVTPLEWSRYSALNGPVDAEITVPELVAVGDLCPHQDYVYFNPLSLQEQGLINAFRIKSAQLYTELRADKQLLDAILQFPCWIDPQKHELALFENLESYAAAIIYLSAQGVPIPIIHADFLGIGEKDNDKLIGLPSLNEFLFAALLSFYIHDPLHYFEAFADHRLKLEQRLRRAGILERKKINFFNNTKNRKTIQRSINKLAAIVEITEFEQQELKGKLRMVILADYICKEFLVNTVTNDLPLAKLGVIPIFEQLRRKKNISRKLAVLTGTLVIVPASALPELLRQLDQNGQAEAMSYTPLAYDSSFVVIQQTEKLKHQLVNLVTQLFEKGKISILVGTKALLGEGWDAPAINSLIIASHVGSFVLSNQVRGRAIRAQIGNPQKTSAIWHLVSIDAPSKTGGEDLALMKRRFSSFVGLAEKEDAGLENGFDRLQHTVFSWRPETIRHENNFTFERARQRAALKQRWDMAIAKGTTLVEEIKIPVIEEQAYVSAKHAAMKTTVTSMLKTLSASVLWYLETSVQVVSKFAKFIPSNYANYVLISMLSIAVLFYGRGMFLAIVAYIKYRDIHKDIYGIGNALLLVLCNSGLISTSKKLLKVLSYGDQKGNVFVYLEGGTIQEQSLFIQQIQEIIDPVQDPRYIIIRKSRFLKFSLQEDFHAVPSLLGKRAALAKNFEKAWKKDVGDCALFFTRSVKGRRVLLHARIHALSVIFNPEKAAVMHKNSWR